MRELTLPGRLMLLPGVGTTPDFFRLQKEAFGEDVLTPAWIDPRPGESAGRYAERWAEQINSTLQDDGRPLFLGGASFGGILALEMAPHLKIKPTAIFLIASTRDDDGLPRRLKTLGGLASKLPAARLKQVAKAVVVPFGWIDGLDDAGLRQVKGMVDDIDPELLHWSVGASVEWVASDLEPGDDYPPVYQLHGRGDRLIPPPTRDDVTLVEHGRHSLTISHDSTVNRWLFDHMTRLTPEPEADFKRVADWRHRPTAGRRVLGW